MLRALLFAALILARLAFAGEQEWKEHMKTDAAAFQRGDYPGAEESYSKALREAEVFGDADYKDFPISATVT